MKALLIASGPGKRTEEGLTIEVALTDTPDVFVVTWDGPGLRVLFKVEAPTAVEAVAFLIANMETLYDEGHA